MKYVKIAGVTALIMVVALLILFAEQYGAIQHGTPPTQHQSWLNSIATRGPVTASDTNSIEAWMTFDYINHLFDLPPDYLQSKLSIDNNRYPHLTITQYAKSVDENGTTTLAEVQNAVKLYFTQNNE